MSSFFKNCRRLLSDMPTRLSTTGITSDDRCEKCNSTFSILRKKRVCGKCTRWFCYDCLPKREHSCKSCVILSAWPLNRTHLLALKARDIKAFLTMSRVSTVGCVEKEELIELVLQYQNNRHQPAPSSNPLRISTRLVDETWVMVDDIGSNNAGTSIQAEASSATTPSQHGVNTMNNEQTRSTPIPVPVIDSGSMPSSLPGSSNLVGPPQEEGSFPKIQQPSSLPEARTTPSFEESISSPSRSHPIEPRENPSYHGNEQGSSLSGNSSRLDLNLPSDTELELLSIKNLKALLTSHRVDFRGCCEKPELLERAKRLRHQLHAQSQIDVGELSDENLCKVCMAAPIDCVLLDCGHLVTCTGCGKQMSECPVCRQFVVRVVKTFRA